MVNYFSKNATIFRASYIIKQIARPNWPNDSLLNNKIVD